MTVKPSLRETMPTVTAWIDALREVFGVSEINDVIRKGMNGTPGFYARENGIEVGTPFPPARVEISGEQMVIIKPEEGKHETRR